jgi:hypothetical protein
MIHFDPGRSAAYVPAVESAGPAVPFGRYVLKERLAQGGMGEVFRAVAIGEHGFEKPVVVKRILPAHAGRDDLAELFVAEAKLMTRLAHPNIVEVLDFGRGEHHDYYLVLELVDGLDLGRLLRAFAARGEPFPVPLALFIAAQILRGLHHAHAKPAGEGGWLVHRDVSPSNVLLSAEGEVKVADFGIALVKHHEGDRADGGGVAGKPGYMAPEQFDGREVDPRADLFSVGVVLHQMLTDELPFAGESTEALQGAARRGEHARARDHRAEVSEELEAILERALAPGPDARFPDARAMAQAIEALRDHGQKIASGDDLAEAVRAAQRELPAAGRRVIALSGTEAEPEPAEAPRELTRSGGAAGVGAFTLRLPARAETTPEPGDDERVPGPDGRPVDRFSVPEVRTVRLAAEREEPALGDPSAGRQRAARRGGVAIVVAIAAIGVVSLARRGEVPAEVKATSASVPPPVVSPPPIVTAPIVTAPVVSATVPTARPSGRPVVPVESARPVVRPDAPVRSAVAVAVTTGDPLSPSAAVTPADDCAGKVHISSNGSWNVSGGPAAVQSPGWYTWRCGTFALQARSREDPTLTKTATVTVRPDRSAEVDLR